MTSMDKRRVYGGKRQMMGEEKNDIHVGGSKKRREEEKVRSSRAPARRENKFVDQALGASEVSYDNPVSQVLNAMVQGDTVNTRDGNKVKLTGVQIKGVITWAPGGTATDDQFVRMLLVYDKRPNLGGTSGISQVLTTAAAATDWYQLRNRATGLTERYRVLKDEIFRRSADGFALIPGGHEFEWFLPINALAHYGANAGTAADLQIGLLMIQATSNVAAAGDGPTLAFKSRVSFEEVI